MSQRKRIYYYPLEELKIKIYGNPDEDFISGGHKTSWWVYVPWIIQVIIMLGSVYITLDLFSAYKSSRDHNEMALISCQDSLKCGQGEMRDFPFTYFEERQNKEYCVKECPVIKNRKNQDVPDRPSKLLYNHQYDYHLVDGKYCFPTDQQLIEQANKKCDFPSKIIFWDWAYELDIYESWLILGSAVFTAALCITIISLQQMKNVLLMKNNTFCQILRIIEFCGLVLFRYSYPSLLYELLVELMEQELNYPITPIIVVLIIFVGMFFSFLSYKIRFNYGSSNQYNIIMDVVQSIIKEEQLVIKLLLPGVSFTILILVWMYYCWYFLSDGLTQNPNFYQDRQFITLGNISYLLIFIFIPVFESFQKVIVYFVDHLTMMRTIRYFKKQEQTEENQLNQIDIDNEEVSIWRDFYILNTNIFWTIVEHTYLGFLVDIYVIIDLFKGRFDFDTIYKKLNWKSIYCNCDENKKQLFSELGIIGSKLQTSLIYSIGLINFLLYITLTNLSSSSKEFFYSLLAVLFSIFCVVRICFTIYRSAFITCIFLMDEEVLGIARPTINPQPDYDYPSYDPSPQISIIKPSSVRDQQQLANSIMNANFKDQEELKKYNDLLKNNFMYTIPVIKTTKVADQIRNMQIKKEQKEILLKEMNNLKKLNEKKEIKMSDIHFQLIKKVYIEQQSKKSEEQIANDIQQTHSSLEELTKLVKVNQQNNQNNNLLYADEDFQEMKSNNNLMNREINLEPIQQSQKDQHGKNPSIESAIPTIAVFTIFNNNGYSLNLTNKKKNFQRSEENIIDPLYLHQMQIVLTGQTRDLGYFCIVCKPHDNLVQRHNQTIEEIEMVLTKQLKLDIQNAFNTITKDEIFITDVGFDNTTGQFAVHIRISPDLFDSRYNNDWKKQKKQKRTFTYRGAIEFIKQGVSVREKQPYYYPLGMQGYGINLSCFQYQNTEWISKKENTTNTWIVLYNAQKGKNISSILIGDPSSHNELNQGGKQYYRSQLIPIQAQHFKGSICRITQQGFERNQFDADRDKVYLADNIDSCLKFADEEGVMIGDKQYQFVFQCRVNPFHVQSPMSNASIYCVDRLYSSNSIRPYRLLVKEVVPKKQR